MYLTRTGCGWRRLPHEFPPYPTVHDDDRNWRRDGTWERADARRREEVRRRAGRDPEPETALLDSQSVKTTDRGGEAGFDAGKNVFGRKRRLLVDTLGLLIACVVHAADVQDRDGAKAVLGRATWDVARLRTVRADGGYAGRLVAWTAAARGWALQIVRRPKGSPGSVLPPQRWVAERTFAWLAKRRRLSKDYEFLPESAEAMIHVAMIGLMLRRLA